jgi:pyruvate dehydrogenase E2 component (dihydrolipoamide acetyltransferase)
MQPVEMPKANENLLEATLSHWLVKEGQQVKADQPICVIITDKATFDMPSPAAGTIRKIIAPEKALLPVGYILCALGEPNEAVPADYETQNTKVLEAHKLAALTPTSTDASCVQSAPAPVITGDKVRATPAARRVAKELGVDLAEVAKALNLTGPVNEKDVKAYAEKRA